MGLAKRALVVLVCAVALSTGQNEDEFPEDAQRFDFSSKGITEVLVDFSGFTELEEIDYSNNDIIEIRPDAFRENVKLKRIDLSGNKNLDFPKNGPFLITGARVLNLSNCHIESVPGNALDEMKSLDVLDLTNNNINFENSLAFENLDYPPRKLIISEISSSDLELICKHVDMTVVIKRNGKQETKKCKDVRTNAKHGEMKKSESSESLTDGDYDVDMTIIEENLLKVDGTHMEMLSDQPDEGSGFGADAIEEEFKANEGESKTNREKPKTNEGELKTNEEESETNESDSQTNEAQEVAVTEEKTEKYEEEKTEETEQHENTNVFDLEIAGGEIDPSEDEIDKNTNQDKEIIKTSEDGTTTDEDGTDQNSNEKVEGTLILDSEKTRDIEEENIVGDEIIIPVIVDGTAARDEIVPDKTVPKRSKGRSKAVPKVKTENEDSALPSGNEDTVSEATVEVILDNTDENKTSNVRNANPTVGETVETPTSAASSIILVLIVAVVVMGSALIGFRYYKSRKATYSPVNGVSKENPTEGKELKEIIVEKQESQPLMEPRSDIQFEEVTEKTEQEEEKVAAKDEKTDVQENNTEEKADMKEDNKARTNGEGTEDKKGDTL